MASTRASQDEHSTTENDTKVQGKSGDETLESLVSQLTLDSIDPLHSPIFICDAGYGLPTQARPRKEKILAISKQLYNFLSWQTTTQTTDNMKLARVQVVGDETTIASLQKRLQQLWSNDRFPSHVYFSSQSLQEYILPFQDEEVIYLSPDAPSSLDPSKPPPRVIIVGLLIDRRIQPHRSFKRAGALNIQTAKWPLQETFANIISSNEPLNVDTILEGMQEWHWNYRDNNNKQGSNKECFVKAASNAMERHAQRHPNRPLHKKT